MSEPAVSTEANSASFEVARDDVFSRIASRYDLLCDLFSLRLHRLWKSRMARRILALSWERMLDVAAGTGDIALRVVRDLDPGGGRTCIVSDICPAMLDIARRRAGPAADVAEFRTLDAHRLAAIETASIDLYAMSLAMKICDRKQALAKRRVLRPGGTLSAWRLRKLLWRSIAPTYLHETVHAGRLMAATGGDIGV